MTAETTAASRCPVVHYDFADPAVRPVLHESLAAIREQCPVGWSDQYGGFWLLATYDDVQDVSRDHERYTVTDGIMIPPTGASMPVIPAELDPPEHTSYRKLALPYFTAAAVSRLEPQIRAIVRDCIAAFSADGHADLVQSVAHVVPPLVIGAALGLDPRACIEVRDLAGTFLSSADVGIEAKKQAARELEDWLSEQIEARRREPREDTLSRLVNATIDGKEMPALIALGMVQLMVLAGHETTVHGLGSMLLRVAVEPGLRERLLADPSLMRATVHETLRIDPPIIHMARTAVVDHDRSGAHLRAGDKVMLNYVAANRDPAKFRDPFVFDIDRGSQQHLSFGSGRHRCIGEHLAVTEMLVVLEEILATIPDYDIVGSDRDAAIEWHGGSSTFRSGEARGDVRPDRTSCVYEHVLTPFRIGPVELRNRVVRTSQGSGLGRDRLVSDDMIEFHVARARGQVALAFADIGQIHWSSPGMLDLSSDRVIPGLQKLTTAVHASGMKLFQQIWHGGPTQMTLDSSAPWAASHVPDPGLGMLPVPMTRSMMDELTQAFVAAALRAREGGIDGIQLHAGHGYLFSSFLSPATNLRTDEYGGPLENRARYLIEVLTAVRAAMGPDYPVGLRMSPDGPDDQTTASDLVELTAVLERDRLIDFVDVSLGSHYRRDLLIGGAHLRAGYMLSSSEKVTRATALPTMVAGRVTTLQQADDIIGSGAADLVAMVRATLAEPDLIAKTISGRGAEVRPCIACLQSCAGGLNTRGRSMCTVNSAAGRELSLGDAEIRHAAPSLRVVVVGGGPAGMEAARAATIAGHRVTLLEASDVLGGQLRLVRQARAEVSRLADYFTNEMDLRGVDVRCGISADADTVLALEPDAVIVATGATPRRDGFQSVRPGPLPGVDEVSLHTGWDVLRGVELGHTVLLVDELGHYEATDVAQRLIDTDHRVLMVSRYAQVAANLEMRWEMVGAPLLAQLLRGDFTFFARSVVHRLAPGCADVAPCEAPQRLQSLEYDDVVMMSGGVPDRALQDALRASAPVVRVIGDANSPRRLEIALVEARSSVDWLSEGWTPSPANYGWGGSAT